MRRHHVLTLVAPLTLFPLLGGCSDDGSVTARPQRAEKATNTVEPTTAVQTSPALDATPAIPVETDDSDPADPAAVAEATAEDAVLERISTMTDEELQATVEAEITSDTADVEFERLLDEIASELASG